jgi:hypothetical protein
MGKFMETISGNFRKIMDGMCVGPWLNLQNKGSGSRPGGRSRGLRLYTIFSILYKKKEYTQAIHNFPEISGNMETL